MAEPRRLKDRWTGRVLIWAGWTSAFVPLTILLHELAHFILALLLGFPDPVLHFSHISYGDIGERAGWQSGLVGLAGPLATGLMVVAGVLWVRSRGPDRRAFAFAAAAASRFFVGVPYSLAVIIAHARGVRLDAPAFDEYRAGVALGLPGNLLLALSSLAFFAVIVWLAVALPPEERRAAWPGLFLGTAFGWGLWFTFGPLLLP